MPRQIDEQAELAEQLHAQMFNAEEPQTENQPSSEEDDSEPIVEAPAAPQEDDLEELRKYKDRYLVLQGKYNAEVPKLHNELKEFKQTVFERLEQQRQPQQTQPEAPQEDKYAKFKEEYGEELFNVMKELAAVEAEQKFKTSVQPVQEQVNSVEENQIKTAQTNFVSFLDSKVKGDWKDAWQGNDPDFMEFLKQEDPSGLYTYGQLVEMYNENWDGDRLAKVFNAYYDSKQPAQQIAQPKAQPKQQSPEQQALIAPSRQTTTTAPKPDDKRIWTQDLMKEFQVADRQGKYSSDESKAMWDDLLAAASEGRIR